MAIVASPPPLTASGMVGDPPRPVVVDAALHLVRGGRASEEESLRQTPRRHPRRRGRLEDETAVPVGRLVDDHVHAVLAAPRAHREACSAIGERTSRRPPGSSRAYALRHAFERARLGAQLLRAAQVEDGRSGMSARPAMPGICAPITGTRIRAPEGGRPGRKGRPGQGRRRAAGIGQLVFRVAILKRPIMRGCPFQSRPATTISSKMRRRARAGSPAPSD